MAVKQIFFPVSLILFFLFTSFGSFIPGPYRTDLNPTEKIELKGFRNLYRINADLYRSEQPSQKGMSRLEKTGIRAIINLRNKRDDTHKAAGTSLALVHIPVDTRVMNYNDILKVLIAVNQAKKPVLVHCLHGSDRTGVIIAAWRMVFGGWGKAAAIAEFKEKRFGYHRKMFPHLTGLLRDLDTRKLSADVVERSILN